VVAMFILIRWLLPKSAQPCHPKNHAVNFVGAMRLFLDSFRDVPDVDQRGLSKCDMFRVSRTYFDCDACIVFACTLSLLLSTSRQYTSEIAVGWHR
jgi:hypothetical protein